MIRIIVFTRKTSNRLQLTEVFTILIQGFRFPFSGFMGLMAFEIVECVRSAFGVCFAVPRLLSTSPWIMLKASKGLGLIHGLLLQIINSLLPTLQPLCVIISTGQSTICQKELTLDRMAMLCVAVPCIGRLTVKSMPGNDRFQLSRHAFLS